ncbi:MAG: hypothetical protein UV46_C0069G0003 [Candidatus Gottesmanbacteria bacterium GW2011_GWC2_42_8]|uniref:WGR domain-containing protein n=1 Tax=Candidatus Gottesmanbacteria bacterium GW2011_GWA2_43_14 TaxID=1618443 RepID=A0A0G1FN90_9BACT|nr:MAG: hypothetical protein UV46_C0069G0003 [Candidatus Gottesmanbacteria bacterium GW2011_GWC2_42_8]KKS96466.1 MAG: hypothetical protein UV73_C0010G0051 [Candidatus Gottesmanbacteria bacterium GW2011_GWA2_43_14]
MHKIIKAKFIKKYWFNIIQTENGFYVFNTQRKRKLPDRDGIGYIVPESECNTLDEAVNFLEEYEKGGYDV